MKIYHGLNYKGIKFKPRAIAIGIFDGVHRGHLKILKTAISASARAGIVSMVVTFEPHPNKILRPKQSHPILMSLAHRLRSFERIGAAEALVIRFDKKFSKVTHEAFLRQTLIERLGMKSLSVGHDFHFGFKGLGDTDYLSKESRSCGFSLSVAQPLKYENKIISSTQIRRLIESGKFKTAEKMLGRPVSVYGTVVRGRGRGKGIGFPTANLNPHHETLPPGGSYAVWGFLNGKKLKGIIHIGQRPTFQEKERTIEVHLFDFHKNIYGKELELIFVAKLRPTQRFRDSKALAAAIQKDARKALKILR